MSGYQQSVLVQLGNSALKKDHHRQNTLRSRDNENSSIQLDCFGGAEIHSPCVTVF